MDKSKQSRNARNLNVVRKKYGINVPKNTKKVLLLDKVNGNKKWAEAIFKEMGTIDQLNVFKYHNPSTEFKKEEGWQCSPMHMIFGIKHDLWHKAHFVVGGYVIDSSMHRTYSSTV
eukprot:2832252-Ditylum_brightwellii.AAC.1